MDNQVDQVDHVALIKKALPISLVAKHYTKKLTRKSDGVWRSNCFLHGGENESSLSIDDNQGWFNCFACGEGGDIFTLWMKMNDVEFTSALESLAIMAHIELPKSKKTISKSRLYEVQDIVADECMDFLLNSEDEDAVTAYDYLMARGMTKKMIKQWRIGLMPEGDYSMEFIREIATDYWALEESGLVNGQGKRARTSFRGRLMMPIIDIENRVVGFSARVIPGIECYNENAKYLNTHETSVYHKSEVLYGEHLLGKRDRSVKGPDFDTIVTIEGQFDAIAANAVLPEGTVALAACGTALTTGHLPQLRRAKRIVELFDGDDAGHKAAIRTFWMLNYLPDSQIQATLLEDGMDPWDMFTDNPDALLDCIDSSLPYLFSVTKAKWSLVGESKTEMTNWIREQYTSLTSLRFKDHLLTNGAKIMGMSKSALKGELSLPIMLNDHRSESVEDQEALAKENQKLVSLQTSSVASMLLGLPYEDMVGALSVLEPWNDRVENALSNWATIINPDDLMVYKRLIFGMDAKVPREIEREVAGLQPKDGAEPQNVSTILEGMIQQMLTAINGMINRRYELGVLGDHIQALRNILVKRLHFKIPAQPYVLSFLLDCAMDIERVSERAERDAYQAS